jgi:hypothetical protein
MSTSDRFSLRNVYLYLVCLITLVIVIFSAVNLVRGVVELMWPDPGYYGYTEPVKGDGLTGEEIAAQEQAAIDSQRRNAVLSLVSSGTALLIAGPLYIYHWRKIERERPEAPPLSGPVPTT